MYLFLKGTKTSIAKVLIYHADSILSSEQMIINQFRKTKEPSSPLLLDYSLTTHDGCQVILLECTNVSLFNISVKSFFCV
jgi:hypothetical protein